ncbi:hypothetical protein [Cetobacterium sp.]|uniref:hypothetical protein n=1 Tax=Cetobacterium sp. TaxID=2071632 RepID=UPI003F2C0D57
MLKLGIAMEYTDVLVFDEETLLGHLFNLKKVNYIEIEKYEKYGEKRLAFIEDNDREAVKGLSYEEKKKRNHLLIMRGALFEIAEALNYKLNLVIGFLAELHLKNENYKIKCYQEGKIYFMKNGRKYNE